MAKAKSSDGIVTSGNAPFQSIISVKWVVLLSVVLPVFSFILGGVLRGAALKFSDIDRHHDEDCCASNNTEACKVEQSHSVFGDEEGVATGSTLSRQILFHAQVNNDVLKSMASFRQSLKSMQQQLDLIVVKELPCEVSQDGSVWRCLAFQDRGVFTAHAWPDRGILAVDFYVPATSMAHPVRGIVETIREHVFPEKLKSDNRVPLVWFDATRGFRYTEDFELEGQFAVDLASFFLRPGVQFKEQVAVVQTRFQEMQIIDASNEFLDTQIPNRMLYLDKITQSRRLENEAYHEALVHPALLTHPAPRRVAIVGGGEGATLREVLKHSTVTECVMIEIDEEMVNVSREHLKEWNECLDLEGSAGSCFEDSRATIYYEDAVAWFIQRYLHNTTEVDETNKFDVIIMDALDPGALKEFSDYMYDNLDYFQALKNSLSEHGILVAQLGEEQKYKHLVQSDDDELRILNNLEKVGFASVKDYSEPGCGFEWPWRYRVVFTNLETKNRWFATEAEIDVEIARRLISTVSGDPILRHLDGATFATYQYPSRVLEEVFCRSESFEPGCELGRGFNPEFPNAAMNTFRVAPSGVRRAGRGLFTTQDIPTNSYLGIDDYVHSMWVNPSANKLIGDMAEAEDGMFEDIIDAVDTYVDGYGYGTNFLGSIMAVLVDPGIMTFTNHGCNGTNNIGPFGHLTEFEADPEVMPSKEYPWMTKFYSPFVDRNHWLFFQIEEGDFPLRDIKAGEEIFDNYLTSGDIEEWRTNVLRYRSICSGEGSGLVENYEALLKSKE